MAQCFNSSLLLFIISLLQDGFIGWLCGVLSGVLFFVWAVCLWVDIEESWKEYREKNECE